MKRYQALLKRLFILMMINLPISNSIGQTLKGLGGLDQNGQSAALAISANGLRVAGFYTDASFNQFAFRWSLISEEFITINGLQRAVALNKDGSKLVGYNQMGFEFNSFKWTPNGGLSGIGDIPGGDALGIARGISNDGNRFVGESSSSNGLEGFLQIDGGIVSGLGDLPGGIFNSGAYAISGDGNTVVGWSVVDGSDIRQPFQWSLGGGITALELLPDYEQGIAKDINVDGSFIVGSNFGGNGPFTKEAAIWSATGVQGLGVLPFHFTSEANGVSNDGITVVGTSDDFDAFIWNPANGMQYLQEILNNLGADTDGWQLKVAHDVSADGCTIVGEGVNPAGQSEAFIAFLGCQTTSIKNNSIPLDLGFKNSPNPFSTATVISFDLPKSDFVEVCVYDSNGKKVANLIKQYYSTGKQFLTWDGNNQNGQPMPGGVYYAIIQTSDFVANQKMVRLKNY